MGFWSFLKKTVEPAAQQADRDATRGAPAPKVPSPLPEDLARLLRVGQSEGPSTDDALALLRHLRASSDEGRALDALLSRNQELRLPEPKSPRQSGVQPYARRRHAGPRHADHQAGPRRPPLRRYVRQESLWPRTQRDGS